MSVQKAIDIGGRLELLVDDYLIQEMGAGASFRLHNPSPREIVLTADRPWEGNQTNYITVFQDGEKYRMYYQAREIDLAAKGNAGENLAEPHPMWIVYTESSDGFVWKRPQMGMVECGGSTQNNVIYQGAGPEQKGVHGFAPFKDANPACTTDARYKAVGAARKAGRGGGLFAMKSSDGIKWSLIQEEPIITKGKFDSQNLVFWDAERQEYRAYVRDFHEGYRGIRTAVSHDFIHWSEPEWLEYPGAPQEQLYTNQITPYYRAPHIFVGFPNRYVQRTWSPSIEALPELEHRRMRSQINERFGTALTDGLFMSSRDGRVFKRWGEAFIRPGPQLEGNWAYGDNRQCWGMLELPSRLEGAPPELSFYVMEGHWRTKCFRRYTLRIDGFVSVNAPLSGGEFVTKPIVFEGEHLRINFATSVAGSLQIELQDEEGRPLDGFSLADCVDNIGDELDRVVKWRESSDVGRLSGKPIRIRCVLSDADLYSFAFTKSS